MDQKTELEKLKELKELLKYYQPPNEDPEYKVNSSPTNNTSPSDSQGEVGKRKSFQNKSVIPFSPQDFLENKRNGFSNICMLAFLTILFEGLFLFFSFILFR